ncbi:DsbE family thiol:disulfide interchange protein [Parashewanella spongiae]|uniref:DsbE family thiol:disulfide interchange protein n=1 Tax=Parashewanella spongiae TaxID=342950 RepID=A0A3A6TDK6_9GAMM|nr:DsbE family thiol:disulfide interchange protein [Parashewanella spongiae]MCL1079913.1 DsbE family thiol:disulfide interchange protein [Parashewanella spongiae]RJY06421.1 DsbE family thiol:disulfide interchange protein [Parashewanella spongiae]
MKKLVLFIPLLGFMVLGIFLYQGLYLNPQQLDSALEGKPVPFFELQQLDDENRIISNKDLIGTVALLNVWGTWCPSCKLEHPYLMHLAKQKLLPIHGINYRDQREAALAELKAVGDPYELNIFDPNGRLGVDLGVYGAPESYIIDHKGIIQHRYAGPIDAAVWEQELYPIIQKLQLAAQADGAQ